MTSENKLIMHENKLEHLSSSDELKQLPKAPEIGESDFDDGTLNTGIGNSRFLTVRRSNLPANARRFNTSNMSITDQEVSGRRRAQDWNVSSVAPLNGSNGSLDDSLTGLFITNAGGEKLVDGEEGNRTKLPMRLLADEDEEKPPRVFDEFISSESARKQRWASSARIKGSRQDDWKTAVRSNRRQGWSKEWRALYEETKKMLNRKVEDIKELQSKQDFLTAEIKAKKNKIEAMESQMKQSTHKFTQREQELWLECERRKLKCENLSSQNKQLEKNQKSVMGQQRTSLERLEAENSRLNMELQKTHGNYSRQWDRTPQSSLLKEIKEVVSSLVAKLSNEEHSMSYKEILKLNADLVAAKKMNQVLKTEMEALKSERAGLVITELRETVKSAMARWNHVVEPNFLGKLRELSQSLSSNYDKFVAHSFNHFKEVDGRIKTLTSSYSVKYSSNQLNELKNEFTTTREEIKRWETSLTKLLELKMKEMRTNQHSLLETFSYHRTELSEMKGSLKLWQEQSKTVNKEQQPTASEESVMNVADGVEKARGEIMDTLREQKLGEQKLLHQLELLHGAVQKMKAASQWSAREAGDSYKSNAKIPEEFKVLKLKCDHLMENVFPEKLKKNMVTFDQVQQQMRLQTKKLVAAIKELRRRDDELVDKIASKLTNVESERKKMDREIHKKKLQLQQKSEELNRESERLRVQEDVHRERRERVLWEEKSRSALVAAAKAVQSTMLKDVTSKIESVLSSRVKNLARQDKDWEKGLIIAEVSESVKSVVMEQRAQQAEDFSRILGKSLAGQDREKSLIAKVTDSVRSVVMEQRGQQAEAFSRVLGKSLTAQNVEALAAEISCVKKLLESTSYQKKLISEYDHLGTLGMKELQTTCQTGFDTVRKWISQKVDPLYKKISALDCNIDIMKNAVNKGEKIDKVVSHVVEVRRTLESSLKSLAERFYADKRRGSFNELSCEVRSLKHNLDSSIKGLGREHANQVILLKKSFKELRYSMEKQKPLESFKRRVEKGIEDILFKLDDMFVDRDDSCLFGSEQKEADVNEQSTVREESSFIDDDRGGDTGNAQRNVENIVINIERVVGDQIKESSAQVLECIQGLGVRPRWELSALAFSGSGGLFITGYLLLALTSFFVQISSSPVYLA